ncbi:MULTISPECIES: ABC transporter ATP-binding protein [unclassified Mesorhizobium]|uniref:ABC transporter ATP-binding protein n=1 Tax=unclassified Mesorhizobium TaxID=325217 RepID=UPI00112EE0B8|nr:MULTISPECIES: ABC transporter ATP-binding protein [unclassified Mesorhizobium]TPK96562.1 ABC transporter ATP-binding protein [Mesorhizobium sp. B2-4-16]TPL62447.1 ABC transporter ATP-binding protein [Mesorhizobium sp. B2-4-3]
MPDGQDAKIHPRPASAGAEGANAAAGASSPAVEFRNIDIAYGKFVAVRDFSLSIRKGSFVTLLGPSGCGKTTILRSIAGLVDISAGQIMIGGRRVDDVPIYKRNIGLVFQSYALFPHKTVFDNVAFGLKYRNVAKPEIKRKVGQALEMVRLPGSEKKLPSQLSGGQQQRIALARAIVFEPQVLLLDEPLSALDANMREEMRVEIKKIQKETGITAIFVTHDQEEALSMSDRIVVMNAGSAEQVGTPEEVYERPATAFVADFLGKANMLAGTVSRSDRPTTVKLASGQAVNVLAPRPLPQGSAVTVVVRPQKLAVGAKASANRLPGRVVSASYLGSSAIYEVDIGGKTNIRANAPIDGRVLREGEAIELSFDADDCVLLDEAGRRIS